jgi:hypothetical protein
MSAVRRELRGPVSDRYLRGIVEGEGIEVAASLGGLPLELLKLLQFQTLYEAELAIAELSTRGEDGRRAARRAKQEAEWVARNPRVRESVRQEREEIAQWFGIWSQTPDVFATWLEIRRNSAEFAERFLL